MSITDLQAKYTNNGNRDDTNGKTIIQRQKRYIQKLQNLVTVVNDANKNKCFINEPTLQKIYNDIKERNNWISFLRF
jgi:glycyl-tRNA synthetase beta subunit